MKMAFEKSKAILESAGFKLQRIDEFDLNLVGDVLGSVGPGVALIFIGKAFFRAIGSHFDSKKIKEILKKCEENKEEYSEELVDLLKKKIIHRPIEELNDAELAEALEKLLNNMCYHHSIYKDNDDKLIAYDDPIKQYSTVKNKIIDNLDEVYKIIYQLFWNLVKLNLTKDSKYENYIYNCCEKLYYMTTKIGNLKRALYLSSKGTMGDSDYSESKRFTKHITDKVSKNFEFDDSGNFIKRRPYKEGLKSIRPGDDLPSDSDYSE